MSTGNKEASPCNVISTNDDISEFWGTGETTKSSVPDIAKNQLSTSLCNSSWKMCWSGLLETQGSLLE